MHLTRLDQRINSFFSEKLELAVSDQKYDDGFVSYEYKEIKVFDQDNFLFLTLEVKDNIITVINHHFGIFTTANRQLVINVAQLIGETVTFD